MTKQFDLFPKERASEQAPLAFPSPAHEAAHPLAGEYDRMIAAASRYVPPGVTVEMCRHPSVIMATFWLFRDGAQVGAVACEGAEWRASRMRGGQPYAQQRIISLEDAIRFAAGDR
jgi:hypothetical protein